MNTFDDLSGKQFGIWKVLEFDHMRYYRYDDRIAHGISYYKCQCALCGRISLVSRCNLLNRKNIRHHGDCLKGGGSK